MKSPEEKSCYDCLGRRVTVFVILLVVSLLVNVFLLCKLITSYHQTEYDDDWMIGKNISEVENRYGNFNYQAKVWGAYYLYTGDGFGILSDNLQRWLYVYYDSDGIVTETEISVQRGG